MKRYVWFCCFWIALICCCPKLILAQESILKLDSISQLLQKSRLNSNEKVDRLVIMSRELRGVDALKSLIYAQQALLIAQRLNYRNGISESIYGIASAYLELNNYTKSLEYYLRALKFYQSVQNLAGIAQSEHSIGLIYYKFGNYSLSLDYFLQAITNYQEAEEKAGEIISLSNLGVIYSTLGNYEEAGDLFNKSLEMAQALKNKELEGIILRKIAENFEKQGYNKVAREYYQGALNIFNVIQDVSNLALVYTGLGNVQIQSNKALEYYLKALNIHKKKNDSEGICKSYLGIAELYIKTNVPQRALEYASQSLELAQKLNNQELIRNAHRVKAQAAEKNGLLNQALEDYRLYKIYSDSLYSTSRLVVLTEMQTRYALESIEKENQIQKQYIKSLSLQNAEKTQTLKAKDQNIRLQTLIITAFGLLIVLTIILIIVLYRGRLASRRTNARLSSQNQAINNQKAEIEQQSKQIQLAMHRIQDNMKYAETIQQSILPSDQKMAQILKEYFVIIQAKEIVSGDFYWVSKINDKIILGVVDCTGHGVPGGFTSMIGHTLLNEIVNQDQVLNPAEILRLLNEGVINVIGSYRQDIAIGMEACLIVIDYPKFEGAPIQLTFAGAKRPLLYIQEEDIFSYRPEMVKEIRGDREPIGFVPKTDRIYKNHTLFLEKGSLIYLSSDGFIDQANAKNKRFGSKRFKQLISECAALPMQEQKQELSTKLTSFQGSTVQRDDITVIGLQL